MYGYDFKICFDFTEQGDWKAVCASRVVTGLAQAGTYPGINMLLAKWVPMSERGRLGTYVYIGKLFDHCFKCYFLY